MYGMDETDRNETASDINSLSSTILSVLAKERELVTKGYRENKIRDEHLLGCGEYFVRVPGQESTTNLQGWENISIIWRGP